MSRGVGLHWIEAASFAGLALALGGCPKSDDGAKPAPSASVSASHATPSSAGPDGGAADIAKPSGATVGQAASYGGTYSVAPGKYYISEAKDFASVKQVKDDPSKHVGEGALSLVVDADGKVTGSIDSGPAGPAMIDGRLIDGEIRGNVRRKDPKDDGLTGTFAAKLTGDTAAGTLSLAESNAAIVREGKLSLKKK
ncbi:MAG TPA: hypothetical protein VM925_06150 [Labilithrix sp.]|nr:hypothetical protein [Labilithrix sp.]